MTKFTEADIIDETGQNLLSVKLNTNRFFVNFNTKQDKTPIVDGFMILRNFHLKEYENAYFFQLKSHKTISDKNLQSYLVGYDIVDNLKKIKSPSILFVTDNEKEKLYGVLLEDIIKGKKNKKSYNIGDLNGYLIYDGEYFYDKLKTFDYIEFELSLVQKTQDSSKIDIYELDEIKVKINEGNYEISETQLLKYIELNKKDLHVAYNLLGIIYYNRSLNDINLLSIAIEYYQSSIRLVSDYYKPLINLSRAYINDYVINKNISSLEETKFIINNLLDKSLDDNDKLMIIEVYGSYIILSKEFQLLENISNLISLIKVKTDVIYDILFRIYAGIGDTIKSIDILNEGLSIFPNSYILKVNKIHISLEELNSSIVLYNFDIIPKLNQIKHEILNGILEEYYDIIDDILKSNQTDRFKDSRKMEIFLISYHLGLQNDKKYKDLYDSIDYRNIDSYYKWQLILLKINENIQLKKFEVAYEIIKESREEYKISFSETIRLAGIFLYNGEGNICFDILESSKGLEDFDIKNIIYWEYKIHSQILIGNISLVNSLFLESKEIFKETPYYSTLLKREVGMSFRDISNLESANNVVGLLSEIHKLEGDSDAVRLIKLEEDDDMLEKLNQYIPKSDNRKNIIEMYKSQYLPHYCLESFYGNNYVQLLEDREISVNIKYGYLYEESNINLIKSTLKSYKYIFDYFTLYNLAKSDFLDYYLLKSILSDEDGNFQLFIEEKLRDKIHEDILKKENPILRKILKFILDKKVTLINSDGTIGDILPEVEKNLDLDDPCYKIIPKWLVNSIYYSKHNGIILISDDTSVLETKNVYGIEAISSFIIVSKLLDRKKITISDYNRFIMNLGENNYSFIQFNADNLVYIFNNDKEIFPIQLFQKYSIGRSFFYLCNQIFLSDSNLDSFLSVFQEFSFKIDKYNNEKLKRYLICFFYFFNELYKMDIGEIVKNRFERDKIKVLEEVLNKCIYSSGITIGNITKNLNEQELIELISDIEYISTIDKDFERFFGKNLPTLIKKNL